MFAERFIDGDHWARCMENNILSCGTEQQLAHFGMLFDAEEDDLRIHDSGQFNNFFTDVDVG